MKIMRLAPLENARRPRSRPGPAQCYQVGASLPGPPQSRCKIGMGRLARPALAALFWIGLLAASPATTNYVAQDGQTPVSPYTSWATAASNIQDAIDVTIAGDTVLVSNGVYQTGGVTNYPTGTLLTNRVAIDKAITVRSKDNDPTNTIIRGAWNPVTTNGPAAVRCVYMTNGSSLIGFMLTNGATLTTGTTNYGGGVYCQSTNTVISNCVLSGNSALYAGGAWYGALFNCTMSRNSASVYGGGTYGSTLYTCLLTNNSAYYSGGGSYGGVLTNCTLTGNSTAYNGEDYYGGGGAAFGTLFNCTIVSNYSARNGGGAFGRSYYVYDNNVRLYNCTLSGNSALVGGGVYNGILTNCTLTNNSAGSTGSGGGANGGILYNCTIANNSAMWCGGAGGSYNTQYNCTLSGNSASIANGGGGGTVNGTLYNCLLINNSVGNNNGGGGAYNATLYNCTLSGNSSGSYGGGARGGSLINCIVYFNSASTSGSNWSSIVTFANTCTAPAATNGVGNITSNPLFVDTNAANYRLSNNSPPLNAGTNYSWMTVPADARSKDLDGLRRIDNFSRQVDMGCYELMHRGTMFIMK